MDVVADTLAILVAVIDQRNRLTEWLHFNDVDDVAIAFNVRDGVLQPDGVSVL